VAHDLAVHPDGSLGDAQLARDLQIRVAAGNQLDDLSLSRRERDLAHG